MNIEPIRYSPTDEPFHKRYTPGSLLFKKLGRIRTDFPSGTHGINKFTHSSLVKQINPSRYVIQNGLTAYEYKFPRGRLRPDNENLPRSGLQMRVIDSYGGEENDPNIFNVVTGMPIQAKEPFNQSEPEKKQVNVYNNTSVNIDTEAVSKIFREVAKDLANELNKTSVKIEEGYVKIMAQIANQMDTKPDLPNLEEQIQNLGQVLYDVIQSKNDNITIDNSVVNNNSIVNNTQVNNVDNSVNLTEVNNDNTQVQNNLTQVDNSSKTIQIQNNLLQEIKQIATSNGVPTGLIIDGVIAAAAIEGAGLPNMVEGTAQPNMITGTEQPNMITGPPQSNLITGPPTKKNNLMLEGSPQQLLIEDTPTGKKRKRITGPPTPFTPEENTRKRLQIEPKPKKKQTKKVAVKERFQPKRKATKPKK